MMAHVSDSDHRKIEATILPDCVVESHQISDAVRGLRRVQITKLWRTERVLGHGAFGEVLLQSLDNDTETKRALKVIRGLGVTQDEFQRELTAMIEFTKPKYQAAAVFVEFFGWFQNPKDHSMYLAMEYMRGGDLEANLLDLEGSIKTGPAISEEDVRDITTQILEGLKIMHAEGFAHRDLKPQNVFVVQRTPQWWVKLGDFGLAKRETEGTAYRTQAGTKQYMGPELYFYVPSLSQETSEYTNAVDIWALGCIVYRILSRAVPFPSLLSLRNYCKCKEELLFEAPSSIISAEGFIRQLLAPHPADRLSANAALEHSWFISNREVKYTAASSISSIDMGSQSGYNTASHLGLQSYLLPPDTRNLSKSSSNRDAPSTTLLDPRPKDKSTQPPFSSLSKPRSSHRPHVSPSQKTSPVNIRSELRRRRNFDITERVLEKVTENKAKDDDGKAKLSAEVDNRHKAEITLRPDRVSNSAKERSPGHLIGISSSEEEHDENEKIIKAKVGRQETVPVESIDYIAMAEASRAELSRRMMVHEDYTAELPELLSNTLRLPYLDAFREGAERRRPKLARPHTVRSDATRTDTAVLLLLQSGFRIEQENEKEKALLWAAQKGHEAVVQLLLEKGASIEAQSKGGWTVLHCAADSGQEAVVQLLLEKGASIEAQGKGGWTVLHCAAVKGHEAVVQLLHEKGASIEAQSKDGWTALHYAAYSGHKAIVQLLIEKGASIEAQNKYWETALHFAADEGHEAVVQLLLEKGASIEAQNDYGLTALHCAADSGQEAVVQLLLEKGASIEAQGKDGWTALHYAAVKGHEAVVQLLHEKGASIEAQSKDGRTALHYAAYSGHKAIVQLLIEKGASIEAQNKYWETALHFAADEGHEAVVQLLLEKGASIEAQNDYGLTALHCAADSGQEAVVQLLLEKGASTTPRDKDGLTALHFAADKGHKDIVRLLRQHAADIKAQGKVRSSKNTPPSPYWWVKRSYLKRPHKTKT